MTFPLKTVSLSNLTVAENIQHTVSLNADVMPPNVCYTGALLKELCDNKVFSIKMGLFLSLHSVKDTENESLSHKNESILDIKTHYKPTETFQYTHFNSCHPHGVKNGFIKGEAMRLLRANSSKTTFEESLVKFKQRLRTRGYPNTVIERSLSEVHFADRPSALTQKKKANERILPFVTTYHPAVNNLKQTLMEQWSLIQNQPLLKTIYLKPPIISYKRGKSLKDTLVRSKI